MRLLLRNTPIRHIILLLSLHLPGAAVRCAAQSNNGALHVLSGTMWVSNPETAVLLDNMDLQYDASPSWLLNNTFRFTGTANSAIGGESQPYVYAVSVAKTSPAKLFLATELFVAKRINFQTGLFDLNSQYIALDEAALLTNESETSRIYGSLAGGVQIFVPLNGPVNANPGNLGLQLTSPAPLGNVTITRGHVPMYVNFTGYSVSRYYDLSPAAMVDSNTTLRFNYFDAELNGLPEDSLGLWESQDATFSPLGFTARSSTLNYVEQHGLSQPGRFTLAPGGPNPVLALSPVVLTGQWNNDLVDLSWISLSENGNGHFTVERKVAGEIAYTGIATLPTLATGGTPAVPLHYTYIDSTVGTTADAVSYRIHETSNSGGSIYSNVVTLQAARGADFIVKCYPTVAVGGQVYIAVGSMVLQNMQYRVFDAAGRLVMGGILPYTSQWLYLGPLSKGIYHLVLQSGDNKFNVPIIK